MRVDSGSGRIIEAYTPKSIAFREGDRIRPVAPFLEVFVRTSENVLEPLTTNLLMAEGLSPVDLHWTVRVGNIKAFRRTGKVEDQIQRPGRP